MMPIDEMLGDLRDALDKFEAHQSRELFDAIQDQLLWIERFCENLLPDDE